MSKFESLLPGAMTVLWFVSVLIASIVYRRMNGKPIISRVPSDAVFHESWCSGRSLRNMITRVGGARNSLTVYVQGNELVVNPKFPFTLLFLPEIFGLDERVPVASITAVKRTSHLIGCNLRITFAEGGPAPLELTIRDESGFLRSLGKPLTDDGTQTLPPQELQKR